MAAGRLPDIQCNYSFKVIYTGVDESALVCWLNRLRITFLVRQNHPGQQIEQFFRQPVREVLLFDIGAHVDERQNCNGIVGFRDCNGFAGNVFCSSLNQGVEYASR